MLTCFPATNSVVMFSLYHQYTVLLPILTYCVV